ncbi:MAG: hypothetical protein WCH78_11165 [Bacteroidota bacterium]
MKKRFLFIVVTILFISKFANAQVVFKTQNWQFALNKNGVVASMKNLALNKEYLVADSANSLLSIKYQGKLIAPTNCIWNSKSSELSFYYPVDKIVAVVKAKSNASYLSFELIRINEASKVELVLWGPFPTSISDSIGEVVGVVRDKEFAIGIQALNVKTLGGYPNAESDVEPSYDIFETGNTIDIKAEDRTKLLFRGDVARPTSYGSVLQAYCRNRNKDRIIENWSHKFYQAPAFEDGGVIGSKIALFGVPVNEALATLGKIEIAEGLPHPLLDGIWGKTATNASESYIIMRFGTNNLQDAINVTKASGLRYLYHEDPFASWGHFNLNKTEFPDNWKSLKQSSLIASTQGVRLGVHTLSNFITTNDAYVTPIPDKRLAKVGYTKLTTSINATDTDITIDNPVYFNQFQNNTLRSAVIGDEIIRYTSVSESSPWKLLKCTRGAFATKASAHQAGDSMGKLIDHAYQVFLTDASLLDEMSKTIARLFNETNLMQISFDGLEGCWSTGMGQYARQLFTKTWYDNLSPALKGRVINDASNPGHFFWHIYTRMNWGEPWYAGFRESQLQLRLKNQQFYKRNLMPSMLGWFSLKLETMPEDIEWMLALGAGYNAGFGLSTSLETLQKHGKNTEIFSLIRNWEKIRLKQAFSEDQKERMRSLKSEYHLDSIGLNKYGLTTIYNAYFKHNIVKKQPGEPSITNYEFENKGKEQPIRFIISTGAGTETGEIISNPSISVGEQNALTIPVSLKRNQILYCNGTTISLYDNQWHLIQEFDSQLTLPKISAGKNTIQFKADANANAVGEIKIELRALGEREMIDLK